MYYCEVYSPFFLMKRYFFYFNLISFYSFLKQHLGTSLPDSADSETMKLEVEQLREKNKELEEEVATLKEKVCCIIYLSVYWSFYVVQFCFDFVALHTDTEGKKNTGKS